VEKYKNQTFDDQCIQKRRPRINFKDLQHQLGNDCRIVFDGTLDELF
jgi:hypothetical protein